MDVFKLRNDLVDDYRRYVESFLDIEDPTLQERVAEEMDSGLLWPEPKIGLNPSFEGGASVEKLSDKGVLDDACREIFRIKPEDGPSRDLNLHRHQVDAIEVAATGADYVLTTGTGSGKSLAYIIPIVDAVLRERAKASDHPEKKRIRAIIVYPMNALANSQAGELEKFLSRGLSVSTPRVTFRRYTGQESEAERQEIIQDPPDILLTNYVMLELILTRPREQDLVRAAEGLRFLVFDELHTYRGRQGADVALLARRVRLACKSDGKLQMVGTSATMSTGGTVDDQKREVANVASLLFGVPVTPDHVIGETLRRATALFDVSASDPAEVAGLAVRLRSETPPAATFDEFVADPLSRWIESTFGVTEEVGSGRLVRATPRSIGGTDGAAHALAELTGIDERVCARTIERQLLAGNQIPVPGSPFPVFAFRLHQFVSRGDAVYASIEPRDARVLTFKKQRFAPGDTDRRRVLLPLSFCRECGADYYTVWKTTRRDGMEVLHGRDVVERKSSDDETQAAYLYLGDWPSESDGDDYLDRLPEDWLEDAAKGRRVKRDQRKRLPASVTIGTDGVIGEGGLSGHLVPAPFRFCLSCGVTYGSARTSELSKLTTLGTGGRSTATTILTLSAVRALRADGQLPADARKVLSFTDNRQDASLQAGHFNDLVEVGLLRSALFRAAQQAGNEGIAHDELTMRVFESLDLPFDHYAADPTVRGIAREETDEALRMVLGYRLYNDLQRGWRITSPNLEQIGLLRLGYTGLANECADDVTWAGTHPALAEATSEVREKVCSTLLDHLRKELAIKVDYLDGRNQERLVQHSSQRLTAPWAFDEDEKDRLTTATTVYPRSKQRSDTKYDRAVFLSKLSGFGRYLRRPSIFPDFDHRLTTGDAETIITQLFEWLRQTGLVQRVQESRRDEDAGGYQLVAAHLRWYAGDGSVPDDPVRVPRPPKGGRRSNPFFVEFYRHFAEGNGGIEAREHTAQVPADIRVQREEEFRTARLPVLFCSPTMELGVDIADLNVVNLRNVPPTPANYAQRSGRAGRQGQPALVITYCASGSAHDQYFFRRPERMVAGKVAPPRIDLANEDLIRSHVHAVWLAETGRDLHQSLLDVLDLAAPKLDLPLQQGVVEQLSLSTQVRHVAEAKVNALLSDDHLALRLDGASWWSDRWVADTLDTALLRFDRAADRWRDLYRAARMQVDVQNAAQLDSSRTPADRKNAGRLRSQAVEQIRLLEGTVDRSFQSDFNSYRYFAAEGFLPGYSFPRLPLSAFIPGRSGNQGNDGFLSRPRFLAINEFGPQATIYHEGSRYVVHSVILPVDSSGADGERLITRSAKVCKQCGYLYPVDVEPGPDRCDRCDADLPVARRNLFRLQNVNTRRSKRINSDEEERQRQGFETITTVCFTDHGELSATLDVDGETWATFRYGNAANLWRINLGWRRRRSGSPDGFLLDTQTGRWERPTDDDDNSPGDGGNDGQSIDPAKLTTQRVVPYVEDTRNALTVELAGLPAEDEDRLQLLASLQAALKAAIQVEFELEDSELAAVPLPTDADRRTLLFYESAEGGAGVLRRLVEEPDAMARVATQALRLCHVDPTTGLDDQDGVVEPCEAACYDCLLSYYNQSDHDVLDRRVVIDHLLQISRSTVQGSSGEVDRSTLVQRLDRSTMSDLERRWLTQVDTSGLRLPTAAGQRIDQADTRPDFTYAEDFVAIYIDGPVHDDPETARHDAEAAGRLKSLGWTVLRFRYDDQKDWDTLIDSRPDVFGKNGNSGSPKP